jgi:hypothetical protein
MYVVEINRPLFDLPDTHPAKLFLLAFIECREQCVGRHHDWTGEVPIEQEWFSETDGRHWTFSGFAYSFLAIDVELDGYLANASQVIEEERFVIGCLPRLRTLMGECAVAARTADNQPVLQLVDLVVTMLDLWERAIRHAANQSGGERS